MVQTTTFFFSPGDDDNTGGSVPGNQDSSKKPTDSSTEKDHGNHDKTVLEKIKNALQDWSNKDQQDQNFDDTRV